VLTIYILKAEQLKFPLNESDVMVYHSTAQLAQQKQKVGFIISSMYFR